MGEGGSDVREPYAVRLDDGVVMCSCGDRLADRIDGDSVVIGGMEFQFRRRSDRMICRSCGFDHPVWHFRKDPSFARVDTGERRRKSD